MKKCSKCGESYPATSEWFVKRKESNDGLQTNCRSCKSKYNKQYRESHRDILLEKERQYYLNNKELLRASQKLYYDKNKSDITKKSKIYRADNRTKILASKKKYYAKHKTTTRYKGYTNRYYNEHHAEKETGGSKVCTYCRLTFDATIEYFGIDKRECNGLTGKCRACRTLTNKKYKHVRNSKDRLLISTFSEEDWDECLIFFDHKDAYTGLPMKIISQDHVIPLSKGGSYVRRNIVACEKNINSSKNNSNMEDWFRKQSFYNKERLNKIYKWIGLKNNIQQLSLY